MKIQIPRENLRNLNRPQATYLVTTKNPKKQNLNLAPINIAFPISTDPLKFIVGIRSENDTAKNIKDTGSFSANLASNSLLHQTILSAYKLPREKSEIDFIDSMGFPIKLSNDNETFIEQSPLSYECKVDNNNQSVALEEKNGNRLISIAEVVSTNSNLSPEEAVASKILFYRGLGRFTNVKPLRLKDKTNPNPPQIQNIIVSRNKSGDLVAGVPYISFEITHNPPQFMIGLEKGSELLNTILSSKEISLSMITKNQLDKQILSENLKPINPTLILPSDVKGFKVPAIDEAPINYWCRLINNWEDQMITFKQNQNDICLLPFKVEHIFANKESINQLKKEGSFEIKSSIEPILKPINSPSIFTPEKNNYYAMTEDEYFKWFNNIIRTQN
ncbi:MAG: flavin reductase [Candidatus Caenarcaniphilales bacterium]|nr:flavin reductase [Candidatus Caenarcaniphilales bacterium]